MTTTINKDRSNQKFGLITGGILLLIFSYQLTIRHHQINILGIVGMLLIVLALATPKWLKPLRLIWDKIGAVMGEINTFLILFLVYLFIVVPMGLIMKLFRQSLLDLKWKPNQETYFETTVAMQENDYKQQF